MTKFAIRAATDTIRARFPKAAVLCVRIRLSNIERGNLHENIWIESQESPLAQTRFRRAKGRHRRRRDSQLVGRVSAEDTGQAVEERLIRLPIIEGENGMLPSKWSRGAFSILAYVLTIEYCAP